MKILVAGKHGQVARALAEAGASAGHDVTLAGRAECDIRNVACVEALLGRIQPDLVVNAAAYTAVDRAESESAEAFAVNAAGAANVARACGNAAVPLIHISTDYVFDGNKSDPYVETDSTAPLNVYGRSKLESEHRVADLCARHVILRTSWVFSPWGRNFVKTMLQLAATREAVDVVHDQRGCPTYAPHLADAILKLAAAMMHSSDAAHFGTYHMAGEGETNWSDFAAETFHAAATHGRATPRVRPVGTEKYSTPARRPANSRLDCEKLQRSFGIRLPHWQTGLSDCVNRIVAPNDAKEPNA